MRVTRSTLPQAPLKKLTLGFLGQGPELEEDIPEPEEMDWWSKYYASLQELQRQVRGASGRRWGTEGKEGFVQEIPACPRAPCRRHPFSSSPQLL